MGGGQFPAGPSGAGVIPDDQWKVGSNSFAKAGVVFGVLAIPLGLMQVIGYFFAFGFAGIAIVLAGSDWFVHNACPPAREIHRPVRGSARCRCSHLEGHRGRWPAVVTPG